MKPFIADDQWCQGTVVRRPCSDLTDMLRRLINCRIIIIIIIIKVGTPVMLRPGLHCTAAPKNETGFVHDSYVPTFLSLRLTRYSRCPYISRRRATLFSVHKHNALYSIHRHRAQRLRLGPIPQHTKAEGAVPWCSLLSYTSLNIETGPRLSR